MVQFPSRHGIISEDTAAACEHMHVESTMEQLTVVNVLSMHGIWCLDRRVSDSRPDRKTVILIGISHRA